MADRVRDNVMAQSQSLRGFVHLLNGPLVVIFQIIHRLSSSRLSFVQLEFPAVPTGSFHSTDILGVDQRSDRGRGARVDHIIERSSDNGGPFSRWRRIIRT